MSENKFCASCGAPLGEGIQFCSKCGSKIVEVSAPTAQPAPQSTPVYSPIPDENQQAKNDKQGKVIARVFGAVAVLAIVFFIYQGFFSYPSKPAKVAEKCVTAMMVDFDAKAVQKYISSDVSRNEVEEEINGIKSGINDMGAEIKKVKATDTRVEGKYAEVTISVTITWLGQTATQDMELSLEKIGGRWKISNLY